MASATTAPDIGAKMTRRQVYEALSGLLLGMFVTLIASTVVSTSLPKDHRRPRRHAVRLHLVVTATLLATTVSTPIWGKLADLTNRKVLIQISLIVFVVGSGLAGLSQNTGMLIAFRVFQGLARAA